jgi:hypothetical protein
MDVSFIPVQDCNHFPGERNKSWRCFMKCARLIVALLMVLPGLAAAQLASDRTIVAQVPFEFVIANKVVPAGECVVQRATRTENTLVIRSAVSMASLFFGASRTETREAAGSYALVFNRLGNQYFLRGIELEGSRVSYRLPESKAEAELRAQNVPASEELLLASLR